MMAAARPMVSIIIPHLNQQDALIQCLESLARQDFTAGSVEIIVVDNGSREPLDPLSAAFPAVIFEQELQPGPGPARYRGVARAAADVLLFIDADCRAHAAWISSAVAALRQTDSTGICGGDVRIDVLDPANLTALEAYESVFAYRQQRYIAQEGFSGTGNLGMTRTIFEAVGVFGGIGIAEDIDWGKRAVTMGHITRYDPNMIVYHPARTSFDELTQKWRRHVAHDLASRRQSGRSAIGWYLRALAVVASIVPHSLTVLTSPRLTRPTDRLRAITVLIRIRWFRSAEMLRQRRATGDGAAANWNR